MKKPALSHKFIYILRIHIQQYKVLTPKEQTHFLEKRSKTHFLSTYMYTMNIPHINQLYTMKKGPLCHPHQLGLVTHFSRALWIENELSCLGFWPATITLLGMWKLHLHKLQPIHTHPALSSNFTQYHSATGPFLSRNRWNMAKNVQILMLRLNLS